MNVVSDFHLHSRFSRAVSPRMNLETISSAAKQKGIELLSVSDFTHPEWFSEISSQLTESADGVYTLTTDTKEKKTAFIFSTEISCIYKQGGTLRRVHTLIFAPHREVAARIQQVLRARGANLTADGRPIIGMSAKALLELILAIDEQCFLLPCHVWTPHFGVYGSASGFDSLEECFEDLAPYIYGIETGISSDPEMNWQVQELQNRSILSFSDAHSLPKLAREATIFSLTDISYPHILSAIKRNAAENYIAGTIEFYPEEGKYHYSGHRNCGVAVGPSEILSDGNLCPKCGKKLTEGVLFRVQQLASLPHIPAIREIDAAGVLWLHDSTKQHPPFVRLVPLLEIIAESIGSSVGSKKCISQFELLCQELGSELDILLRVPMPDIQRIAGEKIAEGVAKVRGGDLSIAPGFDGEYGKVSLWEPEEKAAAQLTLPI